MLRSQAITQDYWFLLLTDLKQKPVVLCISFQKTFSQSYPDL
jgi:hypothetical protein